MNSTPNTIYEVGELASWSELHCEFPGNKARIDGKLWLKDLLGLTGMEVSLNSMPAGQGVPFLHKHRENEELYLFLFGEGEFQLDDEVLPIKPGTCIRVAPEGVRSLRNTGEDELRFLCIQGRAGSMEATGPSDGVLVDGALKW